MITLQVYFARNDGYYLLVVLQVFLVGLGNWSEFLKLAMDNINFGLYDSHVFFAK